jgi:hypothetical protein
MISIEYTDGNDYFSINSKKYTRVYQPIQKGSDSIAIYGVHDIKNQLLNTTHYTDIKVNGVFFQNQNELIIELIPILYLKGLTNSGNNNNNDWQDEIDQKEDKFSKNTAFNKDFGITQGTVAKGNDVRFVKGETAFDWGNHSQQGYITILDVNEDNNYLHRQTTPSDTWYITHNLNKFPNITILDSANNKVIGNEEHIDENNVILTFNGSFSGKATLN